MDPFQKQASTNEEDVILLVVSKGLPDFIRNTLTSIRRCGATARICIALPQIALAEVKVAASGFQNVQFVFLEEISAVDYSDMSKYFDYGSKEFRRFMGSKWRAIRFLLESGFARVIYTDVDVAWIRNPLPLIKQTLKCYEIAIQTEGVETFPPDYCCGFMSFRDSEFVIGLLKQLEALQPDTEAIGDQAVFNRLVASSNDLLYRIHGLSELLFANGLSAAKTSVIDDVLVANVRPMIFHANWTVGIENKHLLLQRTGNWLIDQIPKGSFDKKHALARAIVWVLGPVGRPIAQRIFKNSRFAYLTVPPE
jgi:hypothetical protein